MNIEEYSKLVGKLERDRKDVAEGKREDYTKGSKDVLANFKNQSDDLGIRPEQSLSVHMEKQFSAVLNFIKTEGQSESEPIIKRIGDSINYLELLWALLNERGLVNESDEDKIIVGYKDTNSYPKRYYLRDNPELIPSGFVPPFGLVVTRGTELKESEGKTITVDVNSLYLIPIYE